MGRNNIATLLALVLVAGILVAAGCRGNEQAGEKTMENQATGGTQRDRNTDSKTASGKGRGRKATLELRGDSGTEFSGSCAVGDEEPEEISGQVPESFTYELNGRKLDCKISSDGDVQVTLSVGKNVRSVQRINGGTLSLTYENGSISSAISSSSASSVQAGPSSSQGGGMTSESRNVSGFDEVELEGVGNLSIQQTGSESLTVEAQEDVIPKIRTEVKGNRLIVGPKPNANISTTQPINYTLTAKDLGALKVSGSGSVDAQDVNTNQLTVSISGSGGVKISGTAGSQNIDISGSGKYQAGDLQSKQVKIKVGGSGSAVVNASDELDAKVGGSGSVEYIGNPTVNKDVSGAGRVSKR